MMEFELPSMPETAGLKDAFYPLINQQVSGLIVEHPGEHRLLHYTDLVNAWNSGYTTLREVPGGIRFRRHTASLMSPGGDYELLSSLSGIARVRSRMERLAWMYQVGPAGYCCDGPLHHCYPPYTRGGDDDCVVPLCVGRLP
ncbi:MAG TPA: hypothetical protein VG456_19325 [Candidatus Sulfopaludibacter sp.]|jgi:hypothetical protein|nr:hypothetical protein [Candidatus Sulfopaludibacter sp.]